MDSKVEEGAAVLWSLERSLEGQADTAPLIDPARVYVAVEGNIRCFKNKTGDLIWSSPVLTASPTFNAASILSDNDHLYINDNNVVFSVRKKDGSLEWKTEIPDFSARAFVTMGLDETHLYYPGFGEFIRLDKRTGTIELRVPVTQLQPDGIAQQLSTPALSGDGVIYIPAAFSDSEFPEIQGNVHAYEMNTGEHLWSFKAENVMDTLPGSSELRPFGAGVDAVTMWGNNLLVTATNILYMLDRNTGGVIWQKFFIDDGFYTSIVVEEDAGYIGSLQSAVYALDLNSGNVRWKADSPGSILSNVVYDGGRVFVTNNGGGEIGVWDANSGNPVWRSSPPERLNDNFSTFLSPIGVGHGLMANVGSKKIYVLTQPL